LIVVIPQEHNFYARKVSEIELFDQLKSHQYNLLKDFKHIEQEYEKISSESIQRYKALREHFLTPTAREDEDMSVE
jgi:hypothetical protein